MRIFYDHEIFSMQKYGGVSRYFFELISRFSNTSYCEPILDSIYSNNEYLLNLKSNFKIKNKLFSIRTKFFNPRLITFLNNIKVNKNICDIHHKTYYSNYYKKGCPIIITIHDLIAEKFASDHIYLKNDIIKKKQAIDRSDHVITVSNQTKKDLIEFYNISKEKISVIYHGGDYLVNNRKIYFDENYFQKPFFLFVGKRTFYKNFDKLLKALSIDKSILKNFDIICVGGGNFTTDERELIKFYNLDQSCIKSIDVNDKNLKFLYQSARALIYPSLDEGFGIPILEAMYNKCPVICSKISVFEEIFKNNVLYFDPNDEFDILKSINNFLNRTDSSKLPIKSYNYAMKYNWNKSLSDTYAIYDKIKKNY